MTSKHPKSTQCGGVADKFSIAQNPVRKTWRWTTGGALRLASPQWARVTDPDALPDSDDGPVEVDDEHRRAPPARQDILPLLLTAPVLLLCGWWSVDDGGYPPPTWMVGAIVVIVLLATSVVAAGRATGLPSRAATLAVAAFAAYTAWSFASLSWADSPGVALEGSQRSLLYFACFVLFVLVPWTPRALLLGVGAFVAVVTGAAVITLARLAGAEDPSPLLVEARLAAPLGYQNATAALWTMAALPALGLAVRRQVHWLLRGPYLAAAGLLLGLAVLTQSRGWVAALPVLLVIALVTHPERWRWLAGAALLTASLFAVSGSLLDPYAVGGAGRAAASSPEMRAALDGAATNLWLVVAALLAIGTALGAVDRMKRAAQVPAGVRRASRVTGVALLASVVVAGSVGVMVATDGRPLQRLDRAWTQFSDFENTSGGPARSRFEGLGSTRYDFWRVAVQAWRERPVAGLGQDNFAQTYLVGRQSRFEEPRWTHSLPLRLLTHTGIVGFALFGLFLAAALWGANPFRRSCADDPRWHAASALALLPAAVWLAHGSIDWLWEFPALSVPALALLAAAGAVRGTAAEWEPVRARRRFVPVGVGVAALLALALVVPAYLSDRDIAWASANWPADPEQAFRRLDRAQSLNPLSQRPSLTEGLIAVRRGELDRAREALTRAAAREPGDWFSRFELGLLASTRGDRPTARRQHAAARARNPRDPLVAEALRRVNSRRPVGFAEADRDLINRVSKRLGR